MSFGVSACATGNHTVEGNSTHKGKKPSNRESVYTGLSVPERSGELVFTIYSKLTYPAKRELTEDESAWFASGFLLGLEYCCKYARPEDDLAVVFLLDDKTAKSYTCTYRDYKLFEADIINPEEFWKRLSILNFGY